VSVFWTYEPILEELRSRGIPGRRVRLWGDVNPVGLASLVRLLRRERPDVLVLTKQREYWMGGLAARLAGRPVVALRLGLNRPIVDDFKRRSAFGPLSDVVIVNSEVVRQGVLATPWLDPAKVHVLYNGVVTDPVDRALGRALLEDVGVPSGSPVVVGAGRLTRQKGFDVLIGAFAEVVAEVPGASLVILGEGGRRRDLEEKAAVSGVAASVFLPGHRDDVRRVMAGTDVYALSSRNEGMANTLLEAMSVGAPIVATEVSGTSEAVRDGVDALVVPPGDAGALARGIVRLLRDRDLASALGRSALERASMTFGVARMIDELEGIFLRALEARGRAGEGGDEWRR